MLIVQQVGAMGFCMGGSLTLLAAEYAGIDAAAPFYGTPPSDFGHVSCHGLKIMLQWSVLSCFH